MIDSKVLFIEAFKNLLEAGRNFKMALIALKNETATTMVKIKTSNYYIWGKATLENWWETKWILLLLLIFVPGTALLLGGMGSVMVIQTSFIVAGVIPALFHIFFIGMMMTLADIYN